MPCAVIITANSVVYNAVCEHLGSRTEVEPVKGTVYERGRFIANGNFWEVLIVETSETNDSIAQETERAISTFKPSVVLLVGVACGLKAVKAVKLGDVVAATKVYDYESGKADLDFKPRPDSGSATYKVEQRAKSVRRKKNWLKRVKSDTKSDPNARVEPIASGEKEFGSSESPEYKLIEKNYSDAIAVQIGGLGLLKAVHSNQEVAAMVICGISTLIDKQSEADAYQEIAASHASAFAFEVLAKLEEPLPVREIFITGLSVAIFVIILRLFGAFQTPELWFYDQMIRLRPAENRDDKLLIITITKKDILKYRNYKDEKTGQEYVSKNSASLPDEVLHRLLKKLIEKKPRVIGIDNYRYAKAEDGLKQLINDKQTDKRLIFICKHPTNENKNYFPPPPDVSINQVGLSDLLVDDGGIIRRQLIMMGTLDSKENECKNDDKTMDSFSFKVAQKYLSQEGKEYEIVGGDDGVLKSKKSGAILPALDIGIQGGYRLPNVDGYQIMINYRLTRPENPENKNSLENIAKTFTVEQLLNDNVKSEYIKDKIVLIGTPVESFDSPVPTPYRDEQINGLFIQSQMVSQLVSAGLGERSLIRVWLLHYEMFWILGWSLIGALLTQLYKYNYNKQLLGGIFCFFSLEIISILIFLNMHLWITTVSPAVAFLVSGGMIIFRQKKVIKFK